MTSPKANPNAESQLDPRVEPESHVRVKPETLRSPRPFTAEDLEAIIKRAEAGEITKEQALDEIVAAQVDELRPRFPEERLESLTQILNGIVRLPKPHKPTRKP